MSSQIPTLGRLETVDLREVWPSEPYSFTPWLAQETNLQFLADALGLPGLELVRTEHAVDSFSADIVAKILDTDHHVLIENQLERTDHVHLGQLLTYAPRFDAKVIIWVARQFTDAHRAALDWLNSITDDRYAFFGVEAGAVRIGDSVPAPQFKVIAQPNSWTRPEAPAPGGSSREVDEATQLTIDFWDQMHKAAIAAGAPTRKNNTPLRDKTYWAPIGAGTYAYDVAWRSTARKPQVGVYLGLYGDLAPGIAERLTARKDELEQAYGSPLDWFSSDPRKIVDRLPANPDDKSDWPRQHQWLVERLKKLDDVFTGAVLEAIQEIRAADPLTSN
jgi:hypothetical protein